MKRIASVVAVFLFLTGAVNLRADVKGRIVELERPLVQEAYKPRVLGLFIGIQEFEDPFWHDLKFPRQDVYDMVDFFEGSNTLQLDYKMILTEPAETTRDHILNQAL